MQTIPNTGADFVYSDEIVLSADLERAGRLPLQAGFCARLPARGELYHPSGGVQADPLLDAAGAYESKEFDGAQDHDLILRLTEKAQRIEHIKRCCISGAATQGPTAAGNGGQALCHRGGERAIDAQLQRLGLPGCAMAVPDAPGAFQVRYELTGSPLISVLIPNKDHTDDLDRCLTSLLPKRRVR